jgi:predicted amidohydrolase
MGSLAATWDVRHDVGVRAPLAAIRCEKGDVEGNLASHLRLLADARRAGCDFALFPEMSLTGSVDPAAHPGRLLRIDHPAVATLARATGGTSVGACFGVAEEPVRNALGSVWDRAAPTYGLAGPDHFPQLARRLVQLVPVGGVGGQRSRASRSR